MNMSGHTNLFGGSVPVAPKDPVETTGTAPKAPKTKKLPETVRQAIFVFGGALLILAAVATKGAWWPLVARLF